jgi:hypothetical protein
LAGALGVFGIHPALAQTCTLPPNFQATPLTDFAPGQLYLNQFPGFLYTGSNTMPADHDADGKTAAASIQPRAQSGNPSANGKIVFLAMGLSNTTIEFCGGASFDSNGDPLATQCLLPYNQPQSFMAQAAADPGVNHTQMVIMDGAKGGETLDRWDPTGPNGYSNYDRVRDQVLLPNGLSENQVQAIWVKGAEASPTISLPASNADAYASERYLGNIMRAIKQRYPFARQVFLSSRIYGGYATDCLNPEPYAYEGGFAVKWLIAAQINQQRGGGVDPVAGDLSYGRSPWLAWGPYLWASGTTPRSDGLVWLRTEMRQSDGTHPSTAGEQKVARLILNFMKTSSYTAWFRP